MGNKGTGKTHVGPLRGPLDSLGNESRFVHHGKKPKICTSRNQSRTHALERNFRLRDVAMVVCSGLLQKILIYSHLSWNEILRGVGT